MDADATAAEGKAMTEHTEHVMTIVLVAWTNLMVTLMIVLRWWDRR